MRHATTARPPSRIAPPMPPTTPPMIFLVLLLIPESLELLLPPLFRVAADVMVAKPVVETRTLLPVLVTVCDWPLVTVMMVVV